MLRGAENFIDSLIAVFADVGNTLEGSKNFSNHIFYKYRLVDCKAHVNGENFAISVRNDICRFKAIFGSHFVHSVKGFVQTFPSVRVGRKACAGVGINHQFVFHDVTLAVRDHVGKNFLRFFHRIFIELVNVAPVGLVVHEFIDAPFGVGKGDLEGDKVVYVNFDFHFHVYRLQAKVRIVNRFLFVWDEIFAKNFVLTFLAHTADVVFLDAQGVAEKIGAFAASDARATNNGERTSAANPAEVEADGVECGGHLLRFHYE